MPTELEDREVENQEGNTQEAPTAEDSPTPRPKDSEDGSGNSSGGGGQGGGRPGVRGLRQLTSRFSSPGQGTVKQIGGKLGFGGGKKATTQGGQAASKGVQGVVRVAAVAGPWGWAIGAAVLVLLIIIILMASAGGAEELNKDGQKLTLTKSGPTEAKSGDVLTYQISVAYPGTAQDIVVTDQIPEGTEFINDQNPNFKFDPNTKTAIWNLKDPTASSEAILNNVNASAELKLRATANNLFVVNRVTGNVIGAGIQPPGGGGPVTGDIAKLLPDPIPPDAEGIQGEKTAALDAVLANKTVYEAVSRATGVPWQVFAGIHYREGGADPQKSIVSGRTIGANEPDVVAGPGCSSSTPRGVDDGLPEPSGQFCVFSSLTDSGIYGGILLKQKVDGNLNMFEDLAKALSYYNGGGNANCGTTPYGGCPKHFIGEDDTYVMNIFDDRHSTMYIVYCADYTKCNPPVIDGRPGTATVIKWAAQGN